MPLNRRYRKRKSGPKAAAVRRAGARKSAAIRRAGGRRKYGLGVARYNTMAGLLTNSLWSYKARALPFRVRAMKAVSTPDIWHQNYAQVLTVAPGVQKFVSFPSVTPAQLQGIIATTPSGAPNRIILESAQTELTFTNTTNAAAEIMMYDIFFKRDLTGGSSITTTNDTYPFSNIEQMITNGSKASAQQPVASTDPSTYIGASCFDSQLFKNYCKVVKRGHVMLASGASHRHQALIELNKVADQAVIGNEDMIYLKGYTYATLLLVRGVGAYDPESIVGATVNNVFLNVVTSVRIKYSFVTDNTNTVHYGNYPLPTGVPNVRNIGSGAYEPVSP